MKIYIKNSKCPLPKFICGMITQMQDHSSEPDSLGNYPICGYLYWRRTTTRRRVWSGVNSWDLYAVEPSDGYVAEESDAPQIVLGRFDGSDIGFTMSRITEPGERLPNGTWLPAATVVVSDVRFLPIQPSEETGIEGSVPDAFAKLEFHQPGGEGSSPEQYTSDVWEREFVSFFAHEFPAEYRAAVDKLASARGRLLAG